MNFTTLKVDDPIFVRDTETRRRWQGAVTEAPDIGMLTVRFGRQESFAHFSPSTGRSRSGLYQLEAVKKVPNG